MKGNQYNFSKRLKRCKNTSPKDNKRYDSTKDDPIADLYKKSLKKKYHTK